MSAAEQHAHLTVRESAQLMGDLGLSLVPIGVGQKYPPIQAWQAKATSSAGTHDEWWSNGTGWGIGWKMGLQDNGSWLFALDVDGDVGEAQMRALWAEWDIKGALVATVQAVTGGGGKHFIFSLPSPAEWIVTRSKLADGIDIRAEGGQIVVAPSLHPDTRKAYRWSAGKAPWEHPILEAPQPLLEMMKALLVPPVVASVPAPRSAGHGNTDSESPADWVREHLDWFTSMAKHGWLMVRSLAGQTWWKRPGKTDKGHSAVLHDSGVLVVFSLEIPPQLAGLGHRTRGDEGLSFSLFDFIAAYEHGGDRRALARHIGETYLRRDAAPVQNPHGTDGGDTEGTQDTRQAGPSAEYLPEEFWAAHPMLTQIRSAARVGLMSPDAVFANVLALWATIIPPSYQIPAMLGLPASLNYIACTVGESGLGKSQSYRIARHLVHSRDKQIRFGANPGSGEGMISAYLDIRDGKDPETGDKVKVKTQVFRGINWNSDEGTSMLALTKQEKSILMPTLTSAWSGSALGQENASTENWRRLEEQTYRLTATIGIQEEYAHEFHNQQMKALGVTGRFHFAGVIDVGAPDEDDLPAAPGPLDLPTWPDVLTGTIIGFPDWVRREIRENHRARVRGQQKTNLAESQHTLLRCKIAALLALLFGSKSVSDEVWTLAGTVVGCSQAIVRRLEIQHNQRSVQIRRDQGHARADVEIATEDRKELAAIAKLSDRIVEVVLSDTAARWGTNALRKKVCSSATRHRLEPALNRALSSGRIVLDGDVVRAP